ncbi:hypothetical protein E2I00_009976, partial [Balaenoptera physalus]
MVQGTPLSALRGPPSRDEQKPGYPTPYPSVGLGGASSCPLREDRRPPGQATRGGVTGPLGSRKESETSRPDFRFRRLHAPSRWPPRSPVALASGRRAPQTWSPEHCVPDGRRPMAEGRREGPRQQATHGGGRESPAPPRLAAKQGYQAQQDAALFRAWAIYKGKHLEGVDKEDPSTWKTRLRCALNKSTDFCEVRSRSQLDISNPYKVYRLLSDGAHSPVTRACAPCKEEGILHSQQVPPGEVTEPACKTEEQVGSRLVTEDKDKEQPPRLAQQDSLPPAALPPGPLADHRYQAQDPAHPWGPSPSEDFSNPDFWLHVRLFYGAELGVKHRLGIGGTGHKIGIVSVPIELRAHLQDGRQEPEYQIRLCFGEEYPGPPDQPEERLIMA